MTDYWAWADTEERLRGVLRAFFEELGGHPEGRYRKAHVDAARHFVSMVGERPDLVVPAINENLKQGLGVATLRSLVASAQVLKLQDRRAVTENQMATGSGLIPCPRCGFDIAPQNVDTDCRGHFGGTRRFG